MTRHHDPVITQILLACIVGCLITTSASAMGLCVVEKGGCRDSQTGKLYVQEGNQLVDPETKQVFTEDRPVEIHSQKDITPRTPGPSSVSPPPHLDIYGAYETASMAGKLFHIMDVRPESSGRVKVNLLMGMTTLGVQGCYGGIASGSAMIAPDNSASFSTDNNPACHIKVKFDLDWGAADVTERNCQKVHGPDCSFAGRYLRVQR